jgi:hypothetical protein
MAQTAKYPLPEVFKRIKEKKYWFSAPSRSTDCIIEVFECTDRKMGIEQAETFALEGIFQLTDKHFYKRVLQWSNCVADVYGLVFQNKPWFIKFRIDDEDDVLEEISFHPPDEAFVTIGGFKIPAGEKKYEK